MSLSPTLAATRPSSPTASGLVTAATNLRELLAFKPGAKEYGIDTSCGCAPDVITLIDIEKLMSPAERGLVEQTLQ